MQPFVQNIKRGQGHLRTGNTALPKVWGIINSGSNSAIQVLDGIIP